MSSKVICTFCNVLILKTTYSSTNGFCIPCFQDRNNSKTPNEIKYILNNELSEAEKIFTLHLQKKWPSELGGTIFEELDDVVVGCAYHVFHCNPHKDIIDLKRYNSLKKAVNELEKLILSYSNYEKEFASSTLQLGKYFVNFLSNKV